MLCIVVCVRYTPTRCLEPDHIGALANSVYGVGNVSPRQTSHVWHALRSAFSEAVRQAQQLSGDIFTITVGDTRRMSSTFDMAYQAGHTVLIVDSSGEPLVAVVRQICTDTTRLQDLAQKNSTLHKLGGRINRSDKVTASFTNGKMVALGYRCPQGHPSATPGPYTQSYRSRDTKTSANATDLFIEASRVAQAEMAVLGTNILFREYMLSLGHKMAGLGAGAATMLLLGTPFTSKTVTAAPPWRSGAHRDKGDSAPGFIMWYHSGTHGEVEGGSFMLPDLGVKFKPQTGTAMLLDASAVVHYSDGASSKRGDTVQYGTALFTKRNTVTAGMNVYRLGVDGAMANKKRKHKRAM